MEIGLSGFNQHPWQSVERTRLFYKHALSAEFALRSLHTPLHNQAFPLPHAILNFTGNDCWELQPHPDCPLLFSIHGGAIINQEFLWANLGRLQTTDVLLVNCTSDLTIFRRMFVGAKPHLCHLPLPVNTQTFRPLGRLQSRERLSLDEADYVIGFVCRLLPQKNLHQFLYILAELKRQLSPRTITGIIIGQYWVDYPVLNYVTGHYPHYIANLVKELDIRDNVAFFPAVASDAELSVMYSAMDILIHPTNSIDENFGYAPVEAMACGTPVVAAAYGGLKDTIVSGETGFLMPTWVTPGGIRMDVTSGMEHALKILTDPPLREKMSHSGIRQVSTNYSYQRCAAILTSTIKAAVAKRQTRTPQTVRLVVPKSETKYSGFLPLIQRPWEYYQDAVTAYVSHSSPEPHLHARVRLAAPLQKEGTNLYRMADPAWPAQYKLEKQELSLVQRCRTEVRVSELIAGGQVSLAQVKQFIEQGLLLCTVEGNANTIP